MAKDVLRTDTLFTPAPPRGTGVLLLLLRVVRLRKEIAGELERQKGGRPRHLTARERRRCVTLLTEGRLGVASKVATKIRNESGKNVFDVTVRRALRWEGFVAHVQ